MSRPTWFLKPGFRARPAEKSEFGHTQGGPNLHKGATCGICRKPLLRVWTIDRSDPRFGAVAPGEDEDPRDALDRFREPRFLPLYYCWRCAGDVSYRLVSDEKIKVVHQTGERQGKDFPYADYPESFPENTLELEPVPPSIETSLRHAAHETGWLSAEQEDELRKWLQFDGTLQFGPPNFLRLGGLPVLVQGTEDLACKWRSCPLYEKEDDLYAKRPLRILAVVHESPELPMLSPDAQENLVQLIFLICPACHGIRAVNQCD